MRVRGVRAIEKIQKGTDLVRAFSFAVVGGNKS
jgi:hypothetical protein